ncbi:MAG: hypothetical protein JXR63_06580 [Spirochaetales bacterium]|nr:hypothetical protein [Spirochaetales bacterium]
MKKLMVISIMMVGLSVLAFAEESKSAKTEFAFHIGPTVQYESPILAGGQYNENFAAADKEIGIDDFLLGLQMRADFTWNKVGLRLDFVTFYSPVGSYSALSDAFQDVLSTFDTSSLETLEHQLKFVFNPMFHVSGKFISFGFGPGMSFAWNVSQGAATIEAINAGDTATISDYINRIGLNPADYSVSSSEDLQAQLTPIQQIAFYGGNLDMNLKVGLDFKIGKIVLGVNYIWYFNTNFSLWDENNDFAANMDAIFNIEETTGMLGASVLWRF